MSWLITHKEWNRGHLRQDGGRQGSRITGEVESEAKVPACHIKREDLIVQVSISHPSAWARKLVPAT